MPILKYRFWLIRIVAIMLGGSLAACSIGNFPLTGLLGTRTNTPTHTPTITITPSPSSTPKPTLTPSLTPSPAITATWIAFPANHITAPILLYHHIADKNDRYYVSPDAFRQQMEMLSTLGYTGITISQLVDVIMHGGLLPVRPVVITFDDGDVDVYQNAFPIMRSYGFVGTFYIVGTRLNAEEFISTDQLKELIAAGWDIGCHSMTHIDLTLNHAAMTYEAGDCRNILQKTLGIPITTFAYPFGNMDPFVAEKVAKYGYLAAVGLGTSYQHDWGTLYYLSRLEVQNAYDMDTFLALLPWKDPLP